MGNQNQKLERQVASLPLQPFSSTSGYELNPYFVRKSLRGSRGSKRKQKAIMSALKQRNMDIHGQTVPFIDGLFLPQYPVRNDITLQDFEVEGVIAKGAFGNVIKVKGKQDHEIYAIKTMKKSKVILESAVQQCREEADIYRHVGQHPFIVTPLWFFQNRDTIYIVMEYIPRGDLFSAWKHYNHFSEALVQLYIAELAMALDFLHHSNIIYRDLKMENVLIDAQGHIQLIDFGLAKCVTLGEKTRTVCGTLQYIAPEVLLMLPYTHAVDWWSLGIMMYALLAGQYPVRGAKDHFEMAEKVRSHVYELPSQPAYTAEARDCVKQLLQHDPAHRLCDVFVLEAHPFFASLKFSTLVDRQLTPKTHLQRQKSEDTYAFIHSREQSMDSYHGTKLTPYSASQFSLNDDFAGFDMTRSQSVDGIFEDSPKIASHIGRSAVTSKSARDVREISGSRNPAMSRSSSCDHLEADGASDGGFKNGNMDNQKIGDMTSRIGTRQLPRISALQRGFDETLDLTARLKRQKSPDHERQMVNFNKIPRNKMNSNSDTDFQTSCSYNNSVKNNSHSEPLSPGSVFDEGRDDEEHLVAMRNAAAKIAKRRTQSADVVHTTKNMDLLNTTHPPPPELPKREPLKSKFLSRSIDGAENPQNLPQSQNRMMTEYEGNYLHNKDQFGLHRRSISKNLPVDFKVSPSGPRESLENLSHKPIQGSTEDVPAGLNNSTKVISLKDIDKLPQFYDNPNTTVNNSSHQLRHSMDGVNNKPTFMRTNSEFTPLHKKPLSPTHSNDRDLELIHKRMESLTGEITHHHDKVREWLNSTPDIESMDRYDFEHDIDVSHAESAWKLSDKRSAVDKNLPGLTKNRMLFIDNDTTSSNAPFLCASEGSPLRQTDSGDNNISDKSSNNLPVKPIVTFPKSPKPAVKITPNVSPVVDKENRPPSTASRNDCALGYKNDIHAISKVQDVQYSPHHKSNQSYDNLRNKISHVAEHKVENLNSQYLYRYSDTALTIVPPDSEKSAEMPHSLSSPQGSYATVIEHSVTSEDKCGTTSNRNSYVNERDWAKVMEHLGLAKQSLHRSNETDTHENQDTGSTSKLVQDNRNVNSQVETNTLKNDRNEDRDLSYVNVQHRDLSSPGQHQIIRGFLKTPAKPPRKPVTLQKNTVKENFGHLHGRALNKHGLYMEINEARKLLYECESAVTSFNSSSLRSFSCTSEDKQNPGFCSSSAVDFTQKPQVNEVKNEVNKMSFSNISHFPTDVANASHNANYASQPQLQSNCVTNSCNEISNFVQFNRQAVQVSRPEILSKFKDVKRCAVTINKTYEPESRSASESPIDALWSQVNSHTSSPCTSQRQLHDNQSRSLSPLATSLSMSSPQQVPVTPKISYGEPTISKKLHDIQSEESSSGYTSMGNSLGSKDGLASPKLPIKQELLNSPVYSIKTGERKILPPPIKPKPKLNDMKNNCQEPRNIHFNSSDMEIEKKSMDLRLNSKKSGNFSHEETGFPYISSHVCHQVQEKNKYDKNVQYTKFEDKPKLHQDNPLYLNRKNCVPQHAEWRSASISSPRPQVPAEPSLSPEKNSRKLEQSIEKRNDVHQQQDSPRSVNPTSFFTPKYPHEYSVTTQSDDYKQTSSKKKEDDCTPRNMPKPQNVSVVDQHLVAHMKPQSISVKASNEKSTDDNKHRILRDDHLSFNSNEDSWNSFAWTNDVADQNESFV